MARPRSSLSKFILSLPTSLTAKEVLAQLKAKGMKTTESNVYRVRRLTKASAPQRGRPPKSARKSSAATVTTSSAEGLLRAVAAEVGLGRALDILQTERSRVKPLIG
jgi:hypothetical protein